VTCHEDYFPAAHGAAERGDAVVVVGVVVLLVVVGVVGASFVRGLAVVVVGVAVVVVLMLW